MQLTRNLYQQIIHILGHILAYNCRSANEVFPDDILFSCMNIADIFVAELRKSMKSAIPQIVGFLSVNDDSLCKAGAEVLLNLSQEGSTSCFLA